MALYLCCLLLLSIQTHLSFRVNFVVASSRIWVRMLLLLLLLMMMVIVVVGQLRMRRRRRHPKHRLGIGRIVRRRLVVVAVVVVVVVMVVVMMVVVVVEGEALVIVYARGAAGRVRRRLRMHAMIAGDRGGQVCAQLVLEGKAGQKVGGDKRGRWWWQQHGLFARAHRDALGVVVGRAVGKQARQVGGRDGRMRSTRLGWMWRE